MSYISKVSCEKLDRYFEKVVAERNEIPWISQISLDTGLSNSSISRYAKRRGYVNFAEMRESLLRKTITNHSSKTEAKMFCDFVKKHWKIAVICSNSTRGVGLFVTDRLNSLKYEAIMVSDVKMLSQVKGHAMMIFTISGESKRALEMFNEVKGCPNLLVTCANKKGENVISLPQFLYSKRDNIGFFRSLRNLNEWVQDRFDELVINEKQTKA